MYSVIKVPMRVVDFIEDIPRIYESHESGDIFMCDPDNGFHQKLLDYGLLEHLKKDECTYLCDVFVLKFDNKEYVNGEELDVSNVDINILNNLAMLGQIKKIVKAKNSISFNNIYKEYKDRFNKFADFKKEIKELCNIEVQHHNNIATKEQEDAIREALNGN